jgi:triosephosphate isomerase
MSRKKIIAGNWKMFKTLSEAELLVAEINNKLLPKFSVCRSLDSPTGAVFTDINQSIFRIRNSVWRTGYQQTSTRCLHR